MLARSISISSVDAGAEGAEMKLLRDMEKGTEFQSIDILIGFGFGIGEGTLDRFADTIVPTILFQFGHADNTFKKNGKPAGSDSLNAFRNELLSD